ncbi:hypothetical protein ACQ4LE_006684 [Meloidogyne hapla]
MASLHIKSKFDSEFRRFSIPIITENFMSYSEFRSFIETIHSLHNIPFTLSYTSYSGDLLPITNNDNFRKSLESSRPYLQLLIQRKGESWEEKYGYGTESADKRRRGLAAVLIPSNAGREKRNYNISNPEDFRQVAQVIDVDIVPVTHRRVRLCKYGSSDRSLGFYIRDGTSLRMTSQGPIKCDGIFISRLLEGGLAESTGLLGVGDEVVEVNGIEVHGKTLDQVADMMVANAHNLIITIKPANQRNSLQRTGKNRNSTYQDERQNSSNFINEINKIPITNGSGGGRVYPLTQNNKYFQQQNEKQKQLLNYNDATNDEEDNNNDDGEEEDEIVDHTKTALKIR